MKPLPRTLITLAALNVVEYYAQGYDLPYFDTPTLTANVTHRQDFCLLYEKMYQGEINLIDGLRGTNLTVELYDFQLDSNTGGINNDHISVRFMDELALRAGFTWRNSYGVSEAPSKENNFTWDGLLFWGTGVYDIIGDVYLRNIERLNMGINYIDYWYDGSMTMVMKTDMEQFQWFTFVSPFSWQVWMMIISTTVLSGVIYFLIDYLDSRRKSVEMEASLGDHLFFGAYAFTGHSLYRPRSISTRVMTFSLCFMFLVLMAIYTANMATLLIAGSTAAVTLNTLDDAIEADLTICVWATSASDNYLLLNHPDAKRMALYTEDECAAALVRGDCQVYLLSRSSWEMLKRDIRYNEDCNLNNVGDRFTSVHGSFVIRDNKTLCSKFLEDVLTLHMIDMHIDGMFDKIWNDHYKTTLSHDCQDISDEDIQLDISTSQIASLFILHISFASLALIISLFRCWRVPKEKKERITDEMRMYPWKLRKMAALGEQFSNPKNTASEFRMTDVQSHQNQEEDDNPCDISISKDTKEIRSSLSNSENLQKAYVVANQRSNSENTESFSMKKIPSNQDQMSHHPLSANGVASSRAIEDSVNTCLSDEQALILNETQTMFKEMMETMTMNLIAMNKQKDD